METKSVRLSKDTKENILTTIFKGAFDKKEAAIEQKRFDLSRRVYDDVYSAEMQEQMMALPKGWLPESEYIMVQFGTNGSGYCRRSFKERVRILSVHDNACLKVYEMDHALTHEHENVTRELEDLKEEKRRLYNEAKVILDVCNTSAQLKETWPEISNIVTQYEPQINKETGTAFVPALDGLNKKLGLIAV